MKLLFALVLATSVLCAGSNSYQSEAASARMAFALKSTLESAPKGPLFFMSGKDFTTLNICVAKGVSWTKQYVDMGNKNPAIAEYGILQVNYFQYPQPDDDPQNHYMVDFGDTHEVMNLYASFTFKPNQ